MTAPLKSSHALLAAVSGCALALTCATPASASTGTLPAHAAHASHQGGLQPVAASARTVVARTFGITHIGGYRLGSGRSDHHVGMAIDIMVSGDKGDEVASWVKKNSAQLHVKYVIWEQAYWQPGMTSPRPMADRGSVTANHYDHVHVSFHG